MLKKLTGGDLTPPKFFLGVKKENDRKICGHCYNIYYKKIIIINGENFII